MIAVLGLLAVLVHGTTADPKERFRSIRRSSHLQMAAERRNEASPMAEVGTAGAETSGLKSMYPWYHTSAELDKEAHRLASSCKAASATVSRASEEGVYVTMLRVRARQSNATNKVFILFGEHSRELISPESGLHLVRMLCGEASEEEVKMARETLRDSEFELVLNANPRSRLKVEGGEYCLRTNPAGVDLNRNWDEKWQPTAAVYSNANPGPEPFSEPETRLVRRLVTEYSPTTFLTVHSGTRGLYMPWAYDTEHLADRNQPAMLEILRALDSKHCRCPFGAAGKEVGYECPGTCLDYVYDQLKAPYSFAFEIYASPDVDDSLKARWDSKVSGGGDSLLQRGEHLGHPHFADLFRTHPSDFVQTSDGLLQTSARQVVDLDEDPATCFGQFNPVTEDEYRSTVKNWAAAYLEMSQKVVVDLKAKAEQKL